MSPEKYTPEQVKDIEERVEKAKNALKDLQLRPSVVIQAVNTGNDIFAIKAIPYLADEKYTPTASPLTP